jgi:hypothetical protein
MPICFIEAPPRIRTEAKKTMMEKITTAIDKAYHIGDTLIFLHEYPAENVAMDGRLIPSPSMGCAQQFLLATAVLLQPRPCAGPPKKAHLRSRFNRRRQLDRLIRLRTERVCGTPRRIDRTSGKSIGFRLQV